MPLTKRGASNATPLQPRRARVSLIHSTRLGADDESYDTSSTSAAAPAAVSALKQKFVQTNSAHRSGSNGSGARQKRKSLGRINGVKDKLAFFQQLEKK